MRRVNTIGNAFAALVMLGTAIWVITGGQPADATDHVLLAIAALTAAGWFCGAASRTWRKQ